MAQYNELPVYKATYDLLLGIFAFTKEFGKEYKYTVGESFKKKRLTCSRLFIEPTVAPVRQTQKNPLQSSSQA